MSFCWHGPRHCVNGLLILRSVVAACRQLRILVHREGRPYVLIRYHFLYDEKEMNA